LLSGSTLAAIPELAVVLGIMVLVHEFGHFAAAKLCGVRVEASSALSTMAPTTDSI
jgi:regulator of sigma E protease